MIHSFTELRERAGAVRPQTVAVACAHDAHTLEAVLHAAQEGILNYLLIGHPEEILSIGRSLGYTVAPETAAQIITIGSRLVEKNLSEIHGIISVPKAIPRGSSTVPNAPFSIS